MLTKSDLQEIQKIVKSEVQSETREILKVELKPLREGIRDLRDSTKNLDIKLTRMHKELKEEIKTVAYILDKENMRTLKRVKKIETHLGLPN